MGRNCSLDKICTVDVCFKQDKESTPFHIGSNPICGFLFLLEEQIFK